MCSWVLNKLIFTKWEACVLYSVGWLWYSNLAIPLNRLCQSCQRWMVLRGFTVIGAYCFQPLCSNMYLQYHYRYKTKTWWVDGYWYWVDMFVFQYGSYAQLHLLGWGMLLGNSNWLGNLGFSRLYWLETFFVFCFLLYPDTLVNTFKKWSLSGSWHV